MHIFTTCSLLHVFKMQTKIYADGLLQLLKFLSGLTTRLIESTGEVEQLMNCAAALS